MADKSIGLKIKDNFEEAQKSANGLNKALDVMGGTVSNIAGKIKQFGTDGKKSFNDLKSQITTITGTMKNYAQTIQQVSDKIEKLTSKQSEYIEDLNFLDNAYGKANNSGKELLDTLEQTVGYDPASLVKTVAVYRQMGNALDLDADVAARLSENLTKLTVDVKSITGQGLDTVAKKFQSAMAGNIRAVRAYGVDVTQAGLQQEALRLGIEKQVSEMSRAEKSILTYLTMERQLRTANGDLSRTVNSVANQWEILRNQLSELGRLVGGFFIPVLKSILPALNGIIMALNTIISLIMSFFGIDAESLSQEFGTATSDIDDVAGAFDDVAGSASNAGKAAKEAQKSLRGFDKLNNITTPTTSSGSGGGGSSSGGKIGGIDSKLLDLLKDYDLHLDSIQNKATQIRDKILDWLGFTKVIDPLTGKVSWKYEGLGKTISNMWKTFKSLHPILKLIIGMGIVAFIGKIVGGIKTLVTLMGNSGLFKILKSLVSPVKSLASAIKSGFGNMSTMKSALSTWQQGLGVLDKIKITLLAIAAIGIGSGIVKDGFKNLIDSGNEAIGVLQILGGTGLGSVAGAVAGFALLGTTLGGPVGAAIGAVVGALATLGIGLVRYSQEVEEADKLTRTYGESIAALDETNRNLLVSEFNVAATHQDIVANLDKMVDANGRVIAGNEELVSQILGNLNDAYNTNYKLVDGQITKNGEEITSLQGLQGEINKLITLKKGEALLTAYQDDYNESLKVTSTYTQKLVEEDEDYQKQLEKVSKEYQDVISKHGKNSAEAKEAYMKIDALVRGHQMRVKELDDSYENNIKTVDRYEAMRKAITENNIKEVERLTKEFTSYQGISLREAQETTKKSTATTTKEIVAMLEDPTKRNYNIEYDVKQDELNKKVNKIKDQFNSIKTKGQFDLDTTPAQRSIKKLSGNITFSMRGNAGGGIWNNGIWGPVKAYAGGGFPSRGEIFMARETKGPELVGRIGSSTAILNNDQILEQMTIAVARGMAASGKQEKQVNIIVEADTEGLLQFINFKNASKNRQYGL